MQLRITYSGGHGLDQLLCVYLFIEMSIRRDSGDNTENDEDLESSEHDYADLSRWPHSFIGAAHEAMKPTSTLDIPYFERMLRPLDASEF